MYRIFLSSFLIFSLYINCLHFKDNLDNAFSVANPVYKVYLNSNKTIKLNWILDYNAEKITFMIKFSSKYNWFAIGFSDRGELFPADYCLLSTDLNGNIQFNDTWADDEGKLHLDKHQNCENFKIIKRRKTTKFVYSRKFDTCDNNDYLIEDGTTHIVWARSKNRTDKIEGTIINSTSTKNNGMVRVRLLKNTQVNNILPYYVHKLDVLVDSVEIPSDDTTYWCHVQKLGYEFKTKHHIYKYKAHIPKSSEGLVHHMDIYHCQAPPNEEIPLYSGKCSDKNRPNSTQVCKKTLAAWSLGAPPFTYPEEAGLPIGGKNFNLYIMLEMHYNNPEKKSGLIDNSGISIYVSSKLKKMDAAMIELGLEYTDKMAIPPKQEKFQLSGYCVNKCTAASLPSSGITVFASQLHTHTNGVAVHVRHVRNGVEIGEVNRDNHFSTHFQEIRRLKQPIKVLPGDALITTCDYNTLNRDNVTLGGLTFMNEMCISFIHYYPATDLELCKSSISDKALDVYFKHMKEWENQDTQSNFSVSENYRKIKWNEKRVELLRDVYNKAPISMQCNRSNGDRFPGHWKNLFNTKIVSPLQSPLRQC